MPSFSMHHLWFMVALIVYSLLAHAIHRVDRRWSIFHRVERRPSIARVRQSILLMATGTTSFLLMITSMRMLAGLTGSVASLMRQVPLMIGYAPVFVLGLTAARLPSLRRVLIGGVRMPMLILIGTTEAHLLWRSPLRPAVDAALAGSIDDLLLVAGAAWCPTAAAALILRSATAILRVPPLLRRLSDASLTIYILHYPIIVALKVVIGPLHWHPWAEWAASVAVGSVASYITHVGIVERSGLVALLLNRRWSARRPPTAARPVTDGG